MLPYLKTYVNIPADIYLTINDSLAKNGRAKHRKQGAMNHLYGCMVDVESIRGAKQERMKLDRFTPTVGK